jgi:hypothetical protein
MTILTEATAVIAYVGISVCMLVALAGAVVVGPMLGVVASIIACFYGFILAFIGKNWRRRMIGAICCICGWVGIPWFGIAFSHAETASASMASGVSAPCQRVAEDRGVVPDRSSRS